MSGISSLLNHYYALAAMLTVALLSSPLNASEDSCPQWRAERQLFFGDLHVHTKYSLDASTQGTRTGPADAYRFARGEAIPLQPWLENGEALRQLKPERPLDFAAVTDHAELLGEREICNNPEQEGYGSWQCKLYRHWPRGAFFLFNTQAARAVRMGFCGDEGQYCRQAALRPWQDIQMSADAANDPCEFTSFVAYEWTGAAENLANLHRNIIFRNEQVPKLPFSFVDAPSAPALWDGLDARCGPSSPLPDCQALVIPHNSNLSDGYMFVLDPVNTELGSRRAEQRSRLERLVEIMQHKGASECFFDPLNTEDELCAFEQLPYGSFRSKFVGKISSHFIEPAPRHAGFLRDVLSDGLAYAQQDQGNKNPYTLGVIASTDTHISAPGAVSEDNFPGHGGAGQPAGQAMPAGLPDDLEFNPGGLAAVWAEGNTRASIFAALERREVYATSGPRIGLRLFGAAQLPEGMCDSPQFAQHGYQHGVPMGSELALAPGDAPVFAILAAMDTGTARSPGLPLQKVQIVKGQVSADGQRQETVVDVIDSGIAASVDPLSCAVKGGGAAQLCQLWTDPDYDPQSRNYYYARVLEVPRCRWSQQICVTQGVDCSQPDTIKPGYEACCRADHRPVIQERAWSSPIWVHAEQGDRL